MSQKERFDLIAKYLSRHNNMSVEKAMKITDSSPATIRRDFSFLASEELVTRTHGGIQLKPNYLDQAPPFGIRKFQNQDTKRILALKACELIKEEDAIFADGGTTTYQIVDFVANIPFTIEFSRFQAV